MHVSLPSDYLPLDSYAPELLEWIHIDNYILG